MQTVGTSSKSKHFSSTATVRLKNTTMTTTASTPEDVSVVQSYCCIETKLKQAALPALQDRLITERLSITNSPDRCLVVYCACPPCPALSNGVWCFFFSVHLSRASWSPARAGRVKHVPLTSFSPTLWACLNHARILQ